MKDTKGFDFSSFPTLTTEHLTLRELQISDAPDVFVFRGDSEVQKYNGPTLQSVKEAQTLIEQIHSGYTLKTALCWAVTLSGQDTVLGLFGLHSLNIFHRRVEVGYDLTRTSWGQGIGSEALHAIVSFCFERMNLNRLEAHTIADNHESVRLLERLGFQREGTRREYSWEEDGTFHDSAMYGLLNKDFQLRQTKKDY